MLAREVCDRHRGIGADGLAYLTSPLGMVIYNSDGSPARMCGNALRCLAAESVLLGSLDLGALASFETPSGPRQVRVVSRDPWQVEVNMGAPRAFKPSDASDGEQVFWVDMGNPHQVILLPDGASAPTDWQARGAFLEHQVPGGVNVEFVEVRSPGLLRVHVWERGAGPTLACGTGACACVAAAQWAGRGEASMTVELPGGALEVTLEDGSLWMRGPARQLFEGIWRPDPL